MRRFCFLLLLSLFSVCPSYGVQAYVQSKGGAAGTGSTFGLAFTSNNTAGNLIVACVGLFGGTEHLVTAADTRLNSYTEYQHTSIGNSNTTCWYAKNIASGANTVTVSSNTGNRTYDLIIAEYSGNSTTAPLDTSNSHSVNNTSRPPITGSIVTSFPNGLLIVYVYDQSNAGVTFTITGGSSSPTSGWTKRDHSGGEESALFDNLVTSTGTYSAQWDNGGVFSNALEGVIASFTDGTAPAARKKHKSIQN